MSAHPMDNHPASLFIIVCIFVAELIGAIIVVTSDGFIRWASFGMVGCGLFINYVVNRDKFNAGIKKWFLEAKGAIKEFHGK